MEDPIKQFIDKKSGTAEDYEHIISQMLSEPHLYGYAQKTLTSIYDFIFENGFISDAQIKAVENIKEKPSKQYGR